MQIKVTLIDKPSIRFRLDAKRMLDGRIVIRDHLLIDIIIDDSNNVITTSPKDYSSEEPYQAQNRFFTFLSKTGVIRGETVEGGSTHNSLSAEYTEKAYGDLEPLKVVLYAIWKFLNYEKEHYIRYEDYKDEIEGMYSDPDKDSSTELGKVPHEPKKGSIPADADYWFGKGTFRIF